MSNQLSNYHRQELEMGSGISTEIIDEMRAWTASTKDELSHLGFQQESIRPPALVLPVLTWADSESPAFSRIRPDIPRTDSKGKPRKYEQPPGQSCRIYCLPSARTLIEGLQGVPERPMPELNYIFVTEGEKKAASLTSQNLAALAIFGVWNFKNVDALRGDWDLIGLKGKNVCIVFDSDFRTNHQVRRAEDRLAAMLRAMGAKVFVCRLPDGPNGEKTGADDFFVRGGTVEELNLLIEEHRPDSIKVETWTSDDLFRLGKERCSLWRDQESSAYATVPLASGGRENMPLRSSLFREWLASFSYKDSGRFARRESLERAVEMLESEAKFGDGGIRNTARRIGHANGEVFVDLCDEKRRIVRITSDGWDFVVDQQCPVRFVRQRSTGALPEPRRTKAVIDLSKFFCLDRADLYVLEAFLLGAFMPAPGGFPILVATGEQGSGKSFGCRTLRRLIDPSEPALRRPPKNDRDLAAALSSGFMLAFDNLASISPNLSDSLCALATGGGIAARKLYTDSDEHVVTGRRPVLLNGINDPASAPDLAERSLFVNFIRPDSDMRKTEAHLESEFKFHSGAILGELLDRVARALRDRQKIALPTELPRMADFAAWVYAGTPPEDRKKVWQAIAQNRATKNLAIIEDDPVASAVLRLSKSVGYTGTARELLIKLNEHEGISGPKDRPENWPVSPDALGKHLRRIAPILRSADVEVRQHRGKERIWMIYQAGCRASVEGGEATPILRHEPILTDTSVDTYADESTNVTTELVAKMNLEPLDNDASDTCDAWKNNLISKSTRRRFEL